MAASEERKIKKGGGEDKEEEKEKKEENKKNAHKGAFGKVRISIGKLQLFLVFLDGR